MPNTAKEEGLYTIDDIEALPEGERAELIEGKIYYKDTPDTIHQEISGSIFSEIYNYIKSKNGNCKVYHPPFAVYLNKDKTNYVEPDITVICDPSKLDNKGCHGAPDWIIEIVSPDSATMDYYIKLIEYTKVGVREYWVVDPVKSIITVYNIENMEMYKYTFDDNIPSGIYNGFSIKIDI